MNISNLPKPVIIFILLLLSFSCVNPSESFIQKQNSINNIRESVNSLCSINSELDITKNWNVAVIYYNNFSSSLKDTDKNILNDLANINKKCLKRILIIAHTSSLEAKNDYKKALQVSYLRALNIENYLESKRVPSSYISAIFCDNSSNRVLENKENSNLFNQRVEIIILNEDNYPKLDCIPETKQ